MQAARERGSQAHYSWREVYALMEVSPTIEQREEYVKASEELV